MGGWQCSVSVWNGAQYIRAYRATKPYRVGSNSIVVTFNIKGGRKRKKEWNGWSRGGYIDVYM